MRSIKEQILEILTAPINGHPSREEQIKIGRLEDIVIQLADQIDSIKYPKKDTSHLCCICHTNWVDSDNGYDTCATCLML